MYSVLCFFVYLHTENCRREMNRRIITAILAMLGFGVACSSVRKSTPGTELKVDTVQERTIIRLMYGPPRREYQPQQFSDSTVVGQTTDSIVTRSEEKHPVISPMYGVPHRGFHAKPLVDSTSNATTPQESETAVPSSASSKQ
jgi:hypothetical protein